MTESKFQLKEPKEFRFVLLQFLLFILQLFTAATLFQILFIDTHIINMSDFINVSLENMQFLILAYLFIFIIIFILNFFQPGLRTVSRREIFLRVFSVYFVSGVRDVIRTAKGEKDPQEGSAGTRTAMTALFAIYLPGILYWATVVPGAGRDILNSLLSAVRGVILGSLVMLAFIGIIFLFKELDKATGGLDKYLFPLVIAVIIFFYIKSRIKK